MTTPSVSTKKAANKPASMQEHSTIFNLLKAVIDKFARQFPKGLKKQLLSSESLRTLFQLKKDLSPELCYNACSGAIFTINEIEEELLWDKSLQEFSETHFPNVDFSKKSVYSSSDSWQVDSMDYACQNVPDSIGFYNRFTIWQAVLVKLLDRAVLSAVKCEEILVTSKPPERKHELANAELDTLPEDLRAEALVLFHQSSLWSLRAIRLTSFFASMASSFAQDVIETYVYSSRSQQGSQAAPIPTSHPLAPLRYFEYDKVFVSTNPTGQPGGGFLGFLVLGSRNVDIETACKIYGKEVLAQREISQQLIRLKTFYARTTVQSKRKEELSHFGWYSVEHWITNPLTLLNPSLISVVDYRGFRVVVYPLFYRPPLEINPSSLNITTRLYRELHDLKSLMPTLKLKSVQGENVPMLLRLEERNVGMVLLYKAHRSLLSNTETLQSSSGTFTQDSGSWFCWFHPKAVNEYISTTRQHNKGESGNATTEKATLLTQSFSKGEPFTMDAFLNQENKSYNPFRIPEVEDDCFDLDLNENASFSCSIPAKQNLEVYLQTVVIPRALKTLEGQPFYTPYDSASLRCWLFANGLSLRHLGTLIQKTRHLWLQQVIAVEVVSRTLKRFVTDVLRCIVFVRTRKKIQLALPLGNSQQDEHSLIITQLSRVLSTSEPSPVKLLDEIVAYALKQETIPDQISLNVWEAVALYVLNLAISSTAKSCLFWRSVVGPLVSRRFGCNEAFVEPHNCPPVALVFAFFHHTGITRAVDPVTLASHLKSGAFDFLKHFSIEAPASKSGQDFTNILTLQPFYTCKALVKTSLSLGNFWKSLPLCQLLRRPAQIPLLGSTAQDDFAPNTFFVEHKTLEEKLKSEASLLREKTISDGRKQQLYRLFGVDESLVQHYVAINLRLIAEAISDMTVIQKRQAAVFMGKKFRYKLGKTALSFPENITTDELSIPSLLTRLVPEFRNHFNVAVQSEDLFSSASTLSSPWSVERKDCSYQLQLAFLDFFGWAIRHHAWKIAQRICSDCLALLPPRCIAAMPCSWAFAWAETFRCLVYEEGVPVIPTGNQSTLHEIFGRCVLLIGAYWNNRHPLTVDCLVAYAWILYVTGDLSRCQKFLSQAASHSIAIVSAPRADQPFRIIDSKSFESIPRRLFDPFTKPILNMIPAPSAGAKAGQLFWLLGNVLLGDAVRLIGGTLITENIKKEVLFLTARAIDALETASKIFYTVYKKHDDFLFLGSIYHELAAALFFQHQQENEGYTDGTFRTVDTPALDRSLRLAVQAFMVLMQFSNIYFLLTYLPQIRSERLPSYHVEVLQSAQLLAVLLHQSRLSILAVEVLQQLLRDILKNCVVFSQQDAFSASQRKYRATVQKLGDIAGQQSLINSGVISYRPANLFSFLLWSLPNAHFVGIHDLNSQDRANISAHPHLCREKLEFLATYVYEKVLVPAPEVIKGYLLSLYINFCMLPGHLVRLFRLCRRIYNLHYSLAAKSSIFDVKNVAMYFNAYPESQTIRHATQNATPGLEPVTASYSPFSRLGSKKSLSSEENIMLDVVRNYPRIIPKQTLLATALSTESVTSFTPLVSAMPKWSPYADYSATSLLHSIDASASPSSQVHENDTSAQQGSVRFFFGQLLTQCEQDLTKLEKGLNHKTRSERVHDVNDLASSFTVSSMVGEPDTESLRQYTPTASKTRCAKGERNQNFVVSSNGAVSSRFDVMTQDSAPSIGITEAETHSTGLLLDNRNPLTAAALSRKTPDTSFYPPLPNRKSDASKVVKPQSTSFQTKPKFSPLHHATPTLDVFRETSWGQNNETGKNLESLGNDTRWKDIQMNMSSISQNRNFVPESITGSEPPISHLSEKGQRVAPSFKDGQRRSKTATSMAFNHSPATTSHSFKGSTAAVDQGSPWVPDPMLLQRARDEYGDSSDITRHASGKAKIIDSDCVSTQGLLMTQAFPTYADDTGKVLPSDRTKDADEKSKLKTIESVLDLSSPLEKYSFETVANDVLCSILYWFLDIGDFHTLCMQGAAESEPTSQGPVLPPYCAEEEDNISLTSGSEMRLRRGNAYEHVLRKFRHMTESFRQPKF